jgi:hypothetical protein
MTTIKTIGEFVELVRVTRLAQKEYFRTKGYHALLEAKKHESAVDAVIKEHDRRIARRCQPELPGVKP